MTLKMGDTLADRYEVGALIGRGGMADVYRSTDLVLERQVAVKVLRELTENDSERERFVTEAKTLAKLNHAGLVTVLDAGTHLDRPFLVMEFLDGPTLAGYCDGAPLQKTRVAAFGAQVADALGHAHALGVVHRDVKPSNIIHGQNGRVWLTDFGIARLLGDTSRHTRTGMTIGSPAYLSPEQVRGQECTPAADVYSLGLVLIELLSGERAYPQPSTEAALARLTSPPRMAAGLPQSWCVLLTAMTALHPETRPSAEQVAARLRGLAAGRDEISDATQPMVQESDSTRLMSAPLSVLTSSSAPAGQRVERMRLVAVAAVVVVFALGSAWAMSLNGDAKDSGNGDVPAGVPTKLEGPLGDLHDAVNGGRE